jgi:hypothetical protein
MALDEGPRPKSGKLRQTSMAPFWKENQSVQAKKESLKERL